MADTGYAGDHYSRNYSSTRHDSGQDNFQHPSPNRMVSEEVPKDFISPKSRRRKHGVSAASSNDRPLTILPYADDVVPVSEGTDGQPFDNSGVNKRYIGRNQVETASRHESQSRLSSVFTEEFYSQSEAEIPLGTPSVTGAERGRASADKASVGADRGRVNANRSRMGREKGIIETSKGRHSVKKDNLGANRNSSGINKDRVGVTKHTNGTKSEHNNGGSDTNRGKITFQQASGTAMHKEASGGNDDDDKDDDEDDDDDDFGMADDWQDGKTLEECNAYMLSYDLCSDVTCLVGDQEEPMSAHSFMLMSRSSHFYKLLKREMRHADKIISVPGVSPEVFSKLLLYIYTDKVDLDTQLAASLIAAADKFGTPSLKKRCFEYLLSELSSDNAVVLLEQAHTYKEQTIYDRCLRFILVNAVDVLRTPNFRDLCRECVEKVLGADDLNADEITVFEALMVWAHGECTRRKLQSSDKNRRNIIDKLIFCVRFPIIDVRTFTQKLSQKNILSPEEKILLYQYYHGQTQKLPEHFNRKQRKKYVVNPDVIHVNQTGQNGAVTPITNKAENGFDFGPISPEDHPAVSPKRYEPLFLDMNQPIFKAVRFKGITGSWKINGADAICFKCSKTIVLRGVQVFSSQKMSSSSYAVVLSVFDDMKNEIRNEEVRIVPDKSKVQNVQLSDPVRLPKGRVFTVQTVIKGGPTIRGMDGVKTVSSEGVTFEFINSNKSLNGTDVTTGQIPSILFSVP